MELKKLFFLFRFLPQINIDNDYRKHNAKGQLRQQILRSALLNIKRYID